MPSAEEANAPRGVLDNGSSTCRPTMTNDPRDRDP